MWVARVFPKTTHFLPGSFHYLATSGAYMAGYTSFPSQETWLATPASPRNCIQMASVHLWGLTSTVVYRSVVDLIRIIGYSNIQGVRIKSREAMITHIILQEPVV